MSDPLIPFDHMMQEPGDVNRVCKGLITTALENLCAVETIMQQRADNYAAQAIARRAQRAARDQVSVCGLFDNC